MPRCIGYMREKTGTRCHQIKEKKNPNRQPPRKFVESWKTESLYTAEKREDLGSLAKASGIEECSTVIRHREGLPCSRVEELLECLQPSRKILVFPDDRLVPPLEEMDVFGGFGQYSTLVRPLVYLIEEKSSYILYKQAQCLLTLLTLGGRCCADPSSPSSAPSSRIARKAGTESRSSEILSLRFVRYFRSMSL